jgi:mono/diheme cytochrome c family protein
MSTKMFIWAAFGLISLSSMALIYFFVTNPQKVKIDTIYLSEADSDRGAYIFLAVGCSDCHVAEGETEKTQLAGGQKFKTDFGVFIAPNISNSREYGIGGWKFDDFYTAIKFGQSPEGRHYFPAFPYVAYSKIRDQDIADLWAFWKTLPSIETPNVEHEIQFPFNIRRNIGIWKALYMPKNFVDPIDDRATYLVEALSHCAECHTPRSVIGGLNRSKWMRGAANPSGQGFIPSIHPSDLGWSEAEVIEYLSSGFKPDFDVASGKMVAVIENTSKLSLSDRTLIADYLMRISSD